METTRDLMVLNGQSWKAGQFLYMDTNGLLATCASDADAETGGIKYYAINDQDDPGNNTTTANVGIITADTVFEGNELDGTPTIANVGIPYGIDVTSNVVTVDIGDTGNDAVMITELGYQYEPLKNKSDDIKMRVRFKVLPEALEAANA
jgi:hypothetical protein